VDYVDRDGDRHIETFTRKKDADERHDAVRVNVREGVHTATSKSITVAEAAEDWIEAVQLEGRERTTTRQYRQHVDLHIAPRIGRDKLANLTTPQINSFRDDLLAHLSRPLARKILTSLKSILSDAQRRGNVAQNVSLPVSIGPDRRGKPKLAVGVDIPTPEEIKHILGAATGRRRPFLITAIFSGLRSSELRGLKWADVDLKRSELQVRQRADRYNVIGKVKSKAGSRTIPIGPIVVSALREWRLACPHSKLDLVFPTSRGAIIRHENVIRQIFLPAQLAAGVTVLEIGASGKPMSDENGEAKRRAKYSGLHSLRHFYASWLINRRADGGLELPAKVVQERLGHASIVITMDVYGHLFPRGDDGAELAAAERALLA
jgi:integrase